MTALVGPALAVLVGVGSAAEMFAPFGDPIVMLFLGGFLLAEATPETGLDRRVAEWVLARPAPGRSPGRVLLAL